MKQTFLSAFCILVILFSATACILHVDGSATIDAAEAASRLRIAATATAMRCHPDAQQVQSGPILMGFAQTLCIAANNPDLLVLESDVNRCSDLVLALPCMENPYQTGLFATQLALACPVEVVAFLLNDVNHPVQGNIPVATALGGESASPFYYGCL